MTGRRFTRAQRRGLVVFHAADQRGVDVRSSNSTSDPTWAHLSVYWQVVYRLAADGLVEGHETYPYYYRLTDAGRAAAAEAGIG